MSKIPRLLPLIAIAIGGVVAVRALGVAPGLFDGAKAWAEEAVPAEAPGTTPATPAPAVCALTPDQLAQQAGISPAELRIIQSLSARRTELDARDADFATTLPLMVAAEQKLDAKVQALAAIRTEVQGLLGQVDGREKEEVDRLVAVYSAMRPREAAAVFVGLDDGIRLPVAAAMRPRSLAAVLAQMPPAAARELTEKLAHRFQAQQLAVRAAAAGLTSPTATPTAAPASTPAPTPSRTAATAPPETSTPAAATPPTPRPVANRTPARATPRRAAATPPPAPTGPRPYSPSGTSAAATPAAGTPAATTPTPPRQTVQ
ncbi:MAG: flagellar motility protein MotE (MotC chaperone) [Brevundimonas sp.]|jgi:flagellar motility protein MotE (MotC chaperone)|uniref:MotE family protein n=1 Tax=Brevundimonas sp. TaxID=1871086 RepID=UPI0039E2E7AA